MTLKSYYILILIGLINLNGCKESTKNDSTKKSKILEELPFEINSQPLQIFIKDTIKNSYTLLFETEDIDTVVNNRMYKLKTETINEIQEKKISLTNKIFIAYANNVQLTQGKIYPNWTSSCCNCIIASTSDTISLIGGKYVYFGLPCDNFMK